MIRPKSASTVVSVIIPAFNVENWIEQCLESVVAQSYPNLEIIIIDDGSSDSTPSIIDRFKISDSRIRVIYQTNQGLSAVRNRGIQSSTGSFILFLDSDDWIHLDTVSDAVRIIDEHTPDVVMMRCAKYFEGDGNWSDGTDDFYWRSLNLIEPEIHTAKETPAILALYPLAPLKLLSKSFLTKNGLKFLEGLKYEDNPFHVELFSLNPSYAFLGRRFYAWRQGRPGQITAEPHLSDCITAVMEMLGTGKNLDSNAFPYLIIAITRLICGVAKCIECNWQRQLFLASSVQLVCERITPGDLCRALAYVTPPNPLHPGDIVLVKTLFSSPRSLANALGSGSTRYRGVLETTWAATGSPSLIRRLSNLGYLIRNYRELVRYANGMGEEIVTGLG